MDYRKLRNSDKGACASCRFVRTRIKGETIHDSDKLVEYDGGKEATCEKNPNYILIMATNPRFELPANDCWEPSTSFMVRK